MASVVVNQDINVLANITLESLKVGLQPITAWSTGFRSGARLNDSAKVFVNSMVLDATDFDPDTNNYEDAGDDTSTGVDVTLDTKIKKTAFIEEEDAPKIDITKKLSDLGYAVANEAVLRTLNKITVANYNVTPQNVGAASGFTYDDVVDLEVVADDAGFGMMRSLFLANTYTANLKKDGVLIANKNNPVEPESVWQRFDAIANFKTMSSSLIKTSTPGTGENLVGFITDNTALGLAMGTPLFNGQADGGVEVATVQDQSGVGLQLRRHYSRSTGRWYLNAVMLFGTQVLRDTALFRLTSA